MLSDADKVGRKWDVQEFLQTGEDEIAALIDELRSLGLEGDDSAVDFGCGVGRLSIPLSNRFTRVVGVDIAPTMVEIARSLAADRSNVEFIVNDRPDLAMLSSSSIDLVYSNIVLQHMDQSLARGYLREFFRVVRPNGYVVFQIPSHLTDEWLPLGNDGTVLPDGAHRAQLTVLDAPSRLTAGTTATIGVRVENASEHEWLQDLTNQLNARTTG